MDEILRLLNNTLYRVSIYPWGYVLESLTLNDINPGYEPYKKFLKEADLINYLKEVKRDCGIDDLSI